MSEASTTPDLVELTRRMLDAVPRRDFDALMSFYAPDAKWDAPPGIGSFEGAAAIRSFLEDWIGAWDEWGHKHEDGQDLGNGVVFVALRLDGRPVGSRGRIQERYAFTVVWTAGLIERVLVSSDIDEARAAAERLAESRGKAMSQANLEIARRVFAAVERTGDLEVLREYWAEDIVWDVSRSDFPDKGIYHGVEGVREWTRGIEDAFEGLVWEFEEITDLGQDRVLVVTRLKGHGQFSKIGIDYRFPYVLTFRDGIAVRVDRYRDRAEALKAVGLEA